MHYLEKRWRLRHQRTIVLHAGLPKTGTTYIQNELFALRKVLRQDHQVLMPSISPNLTDALCSMFHDDPMLHITNKIQGKSNEDLRDQIGAYFANIEGELDRHEWNMLILSAEGVYNLGESEMRRLQVWGRQFGLRWKIVFGVRNGPDWVRSVIQEMVKGGDTLNRLYDDLPIPLYRERIGTAIKLFGRSSVTVYSYEDAAAYPQGILSHFLSVLGLQIPVGEQQGSQQQNKCMSHEALTLLSRINAMRPLLTAGSILPARRNGREALNLLGVRGRPFRLPPGIRRRVIAAVAEQEQWLEDNFGISYQYPATCRVSYGSSGSKSRGDGAKMARKGGSAVRAALPSSQGGYAESHGAALELSSEALDDLAVLICDLVNGRPR
ncbi:hypothetical protein HNO88_003925 [Novosphingobium chloroacetimidivorans]|uniref:Uncharacterized protein n=1 Tax=Novosphingobium chloroacetimidivorans TaxID=1428314 RepID=A0A7W7KDU9_9SPHN|nr:hypothetical protein [Novosphingobium chloroacetimidivorans]MBB4860581.1 hypothetical protein [Novosphingobium chloroacetimidivorans]